MDFRILVAAFSAVFIAELADKTQLAALAMSSKTQNPFSVWLGSVAAYMIITAVTVLIGASVSKVISPQLIKYFGAVLFIAVGVLILSGKI